MAAHWYFDLEDGAWIWRQISADGVVLAQSGRRFHYYIDAVEDARGHGYRIDRYVSAEPQRRAG